MRKIPIGLLAAGTGMSLAVSLLMLFAASMVKSVFIKGLCLFVASLMTWIPLREEKGYLFALIEYVLTSGLALLIARSSIATYLYILLFGHYAVVRYFVRTHITDRIITILVRFLVLNALLAGGIALADRVFGISMQSLLPNMSVFRIIAVLEAMLAAFMLLFKIFSMLFDSALRNILMPRR
ncbi:MAG: hypothetical protein J5854_02060 [Clostridia bacterium]|nr:hypothetical protein [Clostridia bacterium]